MAIVILGFTTTLDAQQTLGLNQNVTLGPPVKLDGIIAKEVSDGYLAISVPPDKLKKFVIFFAKTELKLHGLGLLECLDSESKKFAPSADTSVAPFGMVFLDTKEIFPHHKILNRYVRVEGTFTYVNLRGKAVTVPAYVGGPLAL